MFSHCKNADVAITINGRRVVLSSDGYGRTSAHVDDHFVASTKTAYGAMVAAIGHIRMMGAPRA